MSTKESIAHRLEGVGAAGRTSLELADGLGLTLGATSAALSRAQRAGTAVKLAEVRKGYHVYVTPEHVQDRPTVDRKRTAASNPTDAQKRLQEAIKGARKTSVVVKIEDLKAVLPAAR
jgi:hypothetical protein